MSMVAPSPPGEPGTGPPPVGPGRPPVEIGYHPTVGDARPRHPPRTGPVLNTSPPSNDAVKAVRRRCPTLSPFLEVSGKLSPRVRRRPGSTTLGRQERPGPHAAFARAE